MSATPPRHRRLKNGLKAFRVRLQSAWITVRQTDNVIMLATVVLAFVAILQYRVYKNQLAEMQSSGMQMETTIGLFRQQVDEAKKQSQAVQDQVLATSKTIGIAKQQADAAVDQARVFSDEVRETSVARNEAETDRRAWVSVTPHDLNELALGGDIMFIYRLENSGHTPAQNVKFGGYVFSLPQVPEESLVKTLNENISYNKLHQSGLINLTSVNPIAPTAFYDRHTPADLALTESRIEEVRVGKLNFYFQIRVTYNDVLGQPHKTEGLYRLTPLNGGWILATAETGFRMD